MTLQVQPKLFPPKALLWQGPLPYQTRPPRKPGEASGLSQTELRKVVSEMID